MLFSSDTGDGSRGSASATTVMTFREEEPLRRLRSLARADSRLFLGFGERAGSSVIGRRRARRAEWGKVATSGAGGVPEHELARRT